jgi:hypothetical protein
MAGVGWDGRGAMCMGAPARFSYVLYHLLWLPDLYRLQRNLPEIRTIRGNP